MTDLNFLTIPNDSDNLETTASKTHALADTAKAGNSLALFTGMAVTAGTGGEGGPLSQSQDAETVARGQMRAEERMAYDAWRKREYVVPGFDWGVNVAGVPGGAQSAKKFALRAVVMDVIWGDKSKGGGTGTGTGTGIGSGIGSKGDGTGRDENGEGEKGNATAENASWLTFNMPSMLPLITAVTRVLKAEKQAAQGPHAGLSHMEAVEVKTARQIVAAAERNRTRELERIHRLTRDITRCVEVLKSRAQYLEERQLVGVGKKRKPEEHA